MVKWGNDAIYNKIEQGYMVYRVIVIDKKNVRLGYANIWNIK